MSRQSFRLLPGLVAGLCLVVALPASAAKVYQWKDAQGVTHYADAPPAGQEYKNRGQHEDTGKPAATAAAKPVVNSNCSNARSNLAILQGNQPVAVDEDKDGKPDRGLNDSERANRTQLAEAQIKTYCEGGAVTSGG
jgi:hypothetical protein